VHTLDVGAAYARFADGTLREGRLVCHNRDCDAWYPVVDGVPLITPRLSQSLQGELHHVIEGDLTPAMSALLAGAAPDDAPYARLVEHLAIYLEAHWGDRATTAPEGPIDAFGRFGMRAICELLAARAQHRVARAVELGCSCGRGLAELARGADVAVGIDLHFGVLRRARRLLAGQSIEFLRRGIGRRYEIARIEPGDRAASNSFVACGDALDPPLVPGGFQRVSALNVFDSVRDPNALLAVCDGLLAPGGELLFCSPYAFQSHIVDEEARPAAPDPALAVRERLQTGEALEARYVIEDEAEIPWSLRRDARSAQIYSVHWLRARKA
jgi:SAM-dependent methyltransferase